MRTAICFRGGKCRYIRKDWEGHRCRSYHYDRVFSWLMDVREKFSD